MIIAMVCREMKWTLDQYEKQPAQFIDTVTAMIFEEWKAKDRATK